MKQTFLNTRSDMKWLRETHLAHLKRAHTKQYKSALLFGNEDAPSKVHLYKSRNPNYDDPYVQVDFWS